MGFPPPPHLIHIRMCINIRISMCIKLIRGFSRVGLCVCVYTYIHIHTDTHIYEIHIYIYRERERERVSQGLLEPPKTRLHDLEDGLPYLLIHLISESLFPHLFKTGIITVLGLPKVL